MLTEGLTNIARYSDAAAASIRGSNHADQLVLEAATPAPAALPRPAGPPRFRPLH